MVPSAPIHTYGRGASLEYERTLVPNTLVLVSKGYLKSMQRNVRRCESFYLRFLIGQDNSIAEISNITNANTNNAEVMLDSPN